MITYTQSTIRWKPCKILRLNSTSNPPPATTTTTTTMLQPKIWESPSPSPSSTTADVTEPSSIDENDKDYNNIIIYTSIAVCLTIIVVIITVVFIEKAKRSREELGTSSADHYFFFFNAFPRSQYREFSKKKSVNGKTLLNSSP